MNNRRYDIYVGFANCDKEAFKERLLEYCNEEKIAFSFTEQMGGYVFSSGEYIVEESLRISLVGDYNKEDIKEFADNVKREYDQESLLVNIKNIDMEYR